MVNPDPSAIECQFDMGACVVILQRVVIPGPIPRTQSGVAKERAPAYHQAHPMELQVNGSMTMLYENGAKVEKDCSEDKLNKVLELNGSDSSVTIDSREKRRVQKLLIARMLDLEKPVMTEKMINFLSGDGACESYMTLITQIPEEDEDRVDPPEQGQGSYKRPEPGDKLSDELKRSFRATILLTNAEPSDAHRNLLQKKTPCMTAAVLKVFWTSAKGSLHHACCVLDYLLRSHADQVFETLGKCRESLERHLGPMLQWAEYAPVSETMVKLLTFPSVAGSAASYQTSAPSKWKLYSGLADWRFLLRVAENIFDRNCSDAHVSACADLLLEVVERLSSDDNGELLLQPIGYCRELVDGLAAMAVDEDLPLERRTDGARTLLGITQKAAEDTIMFVNARTSMYDSTPTTTIVPNRLSSVRELLHEQLRAWLPDFCAAVSNCDKSASGGGMNEPTAAVAHPGYHVNHPFTMLRYTLVGVLVEIVDRDPRQLDALPVELWKVLCGWFFRYPHNNLYHGVFYKLVFKALRSNSVGALRMAVSKGRLVAQLVDSHVGGDKSAGNRGYVLQLCNAIRLQADTMPPTAFLRTYLSSHEQWRNFLGALREATIQQQNPGLGFEVPIIPRYCADGSEPISKQPGSTGLTEDGGIDHGSAYARALGFEDDIVWVADEATSARKSKRKKKKKKKKKRGPEGAASINEEAAVDSNEGGDVDESTVVIDEDSDAGDSDG